MTNYLSPLKNWLKQIVKCRFCQSDLSSQSNQLNLNQQQIKEQTFFFTRCRFCKHILYFWKDLKNQKFYFVNKLNVVLLTPEIPGNVGTVIRLACAFDITLHLIEPFGFIYSEKWLRRSSTNHFHLADTRIYSSWEEFHKLNSSGIFVLTSSKAKQNFDQINFQKFSQPIYLIFGSESKGLPYELTKKYSEYLFRIPQTSLTSSINLGHAVAICSAFVRFQYFNFTFQN